MKLVLINTKHTPTELENIISAQKPQYVAFLKSLYKTFDYVEFVTDDNHVQMIAFLSQDALDSLLIQYNKLKIDFEGKDLIKKILKGDMQTFEFPSMYSEFPEELVELNAKFFALYTSFLQHNITVDVVLDKINQYGIESLTDFDKQFLANY